MTDQPETPKILDQISKGTNASATRKQENARRRLIIALLFFVPLVSVICLLGYRQLELRAMLIELQSAEDRTDELSLALQQQREDMQRLRDEIALLSLPEQGREAELLALQSRIDSDLKQLDRKVAELTEAGFEAAAPQDSRWKILEANYFARLAVQKLELERDIPSAMNLIQRSDRALSESGSTNVLRVRQQLARDIEVLRSTSVPDQEAAIFRLQALIERVESLSLLASQRKKLLSGQTARSPRTDDVDGNTIGLLDATFQFLGTIFVWRKWEDSPEAMLIPGQEAVIKQSFRLMLEQAKFAVLKRSDLLYQHHLKNAMGWLQTYTVTDMGSGEAIYRELSELTAIEVDPELPSLSESLRTLEQLAASVR